MGERFERIRGLLAETLERPAAERTAFLARACPDPAEREEVQGLLDAALKADSFLSPAPGLAGTPFSLALSTGDRVASFRILRKLGAGGMGTVFEAEQDTPRRRVALKVLNSGILAPASIRRFHYEVEVLGRLRHPGIAQIYETGVHLLEENGTRREIPWFAMEYVAGAKPLLEHANERALDLRGRLTLFSRVLDAVQHGHQHGVIHRDLKPDNVLVDSAGQPKVIDFGVARVADPDLVVATMQTHPGEIVGTVAYMSPEQIVADEGLDTRSDVYSLGVLLYQLLTGALPIQVAHTDVVTSARRIQEDAPQRPAAIRPELAGDVEAILLKALEKRPERRYAAAESFAADVRRFLAREPVEARPPSVGYHLRLFARRNRALVWGAAATLLVAVVGAAVSLGFAIRSNHAERKAVEERKRAEAFSETLFERSLTATIELAPAIHALAGGAEPASKIVSSVIEDLRLLEARAAGDVRVRLLLGRTWIALGDAQGNPAVTNLGDRRGAVASYEEARKIAGELLEASPEDRDARLLHLRTTERLALLTAVEERRLRMRRQPYAAEQERRRALLEEGLAAADSLASDHPRDEGVVYQHALLAMAMGELASDANDAAAARRHAREAIAIWEGLAGWASDARTALEDRADAHALIALTYRREKLWPKAQAAWAEAVALRRPSAEAPGAAYRTRFVYGALLMRFANAARQAGDAGAARESAERSAVIFRELCGADPDDQQARIQLQVSLRELFLVYEQLAEAPDLAEEDRIRWLERAIGAVEEAIEHLGDPTENAIRAKMHGRLEDRRRRLKTRLGE